MENKEAINHLLKVRNIAVKHIEESQKTSIEINLKSSYDDIKSIDTAIKALENMEKVKDFCNTKTVVFIAPKSWVDGYNCAKRDVREIIEG